ncbi:hypothetical protein ACH4FA_30680 [Streptomyces sp. NPDC017966]|uniref:hypothetical protein n=1 Tax=Streptomyces sp. NPDC017966 TaxID=3365023 RepID=UPI00378857B6
MTSDQEAVAAEDTIARVAWQRVFEVSRDTISSCFARGEPRATAAAMIAGLLGLLDTRNCWTPAQQAGQPGPHRMHDQARENIARLVVRELAGQDVVLVTDETGEAKSSATCVGAAAGLGCGRGAP